MKNYNEIDDAFKAYRSAGAFEEAGKLVENYSLEELEKSSLNSLELITVISRYLKRYPLSQAEQSHFINLVIKISLLSRLN